MGLKAAVSEKDGNITFLRSQLEDLASQNSGLQVNRINSLVTDSIREDGQTILKSVLIGFSN